MRLKDKVAIITGAGQRAGEGAVLRRHRYGGAHCRQTGEAEQPGDKPGAELHCMHARLHGPA